MLSNDSLSSSKDRLASKRAKNGLQAEREHFNNIFTTSDRTVHKVGKATRASKKIEKGLHGLMECKKASQQVFSEVAQITKKNGNKRVKKGKIKAKEKKFTRISTSEKELIIGAMDKNIEVAGALKNIKEISENAQSKSRETIRRLERAPVIFNELIDKAKSLEVNAMSYMRESLFEFKSINLHFADFVDFIKNHIIEWAGIINKTPYLCTNCDSIYFTKKADIKLKKRSCDLSFMVNLLAVFPRHGKERTIDEYRLRFFCAIKCKASKVSEVPWPTLIVGGKSNNRYRHSCINDLLKKDRPLTKAEVQLEHLNIMRMFGFKPREAQNEAYLERLYRLEEVSSREDSSSLGKRDLNERSQSSSSKVSREPLKPEDFDKVIDGDDLKKYDKLMIEFDGDYENEWDISKIKRIVMRSVHGRKVKL